MSTFWDTVCTRWSWVRNKTRRPQIALAVSSIFDFASIRFFDSLNCEIRQRCNLIAIGAMPTFSNVVLVFRLNQCQKVKSRPKLKHSDPVCNQLTRSQRFSRRPKRHCSDTSKVNRLIRNKPDGENSTSQISKTHPWVATYRQNLLPQDQCCSWGLIFYSRKEIRFYINMFLNNMMLITSINILHVQGRADNCGCRFARAQANVQILRHIRQKLNVHPQLLALVDIP